MQSDRETKPDVAGSDDSKHQTDDARRAAMLKLATYTAPAMLALLISQKSASAS